MKVTNTLAYLRRARKSFVTVQGLLHGPEKSEGEVVWQLRVFWSKNICPTNIWSTQNEIVDQSTTSTDLPSSIDIYDASTKQCVDLMPVGQMSVSQMSVSQKSVSQKSVSQMSVRQINVCQTNVC